VLILPGLRAMPKRKLGIDVLTAARERIVWVFDTFARICVSFSGGKDSTVMLHLVMEEAIKRKQKVAVLFIDLEGQYRLTIEHTLELYELYSEYIDPYWVALPLDLVNAVSQYEPKWLCWDPERQNDWIRKPPKVAITDHDYFPFFRVGMEFEEFVPLFGEWYAQEQLTATLVGIRSDESLNRYRTLASKTKQSFEGRQWTTYIQDAKWVYNVYPIYDWRTEDIWTYCGQTGKPYNRLYDRMHQAGLSIHQQRICQPYGNDQRKGLWLFHLIEPETWARIVARVNGANQGALYAKESGNILGNIKITRPEGHTWESFAKLLLHSMPAKTRDHYEDKIAIFLHWWATKGDYTNGIPDEGDKQLEAEKKIPSWRRICKVLLRNDYWCKGMSFGQTKATSYERYKKLMKKRRAEWDLI
jgi:predicted phosphoadenosine phosphosulfate sulfurtransferase